MYNERCVFALSLCYTFNISRGSVFVNIITLYERKLFLANIDRPTRLLLRIGGEKSQWLEGHYGEPFPSSPLFSPYFLFPLLFPSPPLS